VNPVVCVQINRHPTKSGWVVSTTRTNGPAHPSGRPHPEICGVFKDYRSAIRAARRLEKDTR
jgi:hypothetical protein